MTVGIFSIGVSALQNAQINLMTTEHNISNIDTAGYSRQRSIQQTNVPYWTGAGYVGTGAHIQTIERMYDSFVVRQVNREQTSVSELETYSAQLAHINNILMDDTAGLSSSIKDFFAGIQQVAADPSSLTARQSMVSMGQVLAGRFQSLDSRLSEQYRNANTQIQGDVSLINSYARQIADLNAQITVAEAAYQPPNDLYDRRDQLVAELNTHIRVSVTQDSSGSYNVSVGTGHQLVTGTHVTEMAVIPSSSDPTRLSVGLKMPGGVIQELPDAEVVGGSLGGILKFRSETLDKTSNTLGMIAASFALTFNAQHELGQDLAGNILGDANFMAKFFTIPEPNVIANSKNAANAPAVSASFSAPSYDGNFYTNLTDSDYKLEWDPAGTAWTLTRLTDNKQWTGATVNNLQDASGQIMNEGFDLSATIPVTSDRGTYLIQPTRDMARNFAVDPKMAADVRQIAVASPGRTLQAATNTGSATISAGIVTPDAIDRTTPGSPHYKMTAPIELTYDKTTNTFNVAGVDWNSTPPHTLQSYTGNVDVYSGGALVYSGSAPVPYTNGATIEIAGIRFEITGIPDNGDKFTVERNDGGIMDNRNALLLGQLQTNSTMSGKTTGFLGGYAQLVGDLGSKGREVTATLAAHTILRNQAQDTRESISGVNLDEEAANLLHFQQMYQAAAKMIDVASRMFDAVLGIRS